MALPYCHQTLFPSFCLFIQWDEVRKSCSSPTGSFLAVNALPNWQATNSPPAGHCWQSHTMILACQLFGSFELMGLRWLKASESLVDVCLQCFKELVPNVYKVFITTFCKSTISWDYGLFFLLILKSQCVKVSFNCFFKWHLGLEDWKLAKDKWCNQKEEETGALR